MIELFTNIVNGFQLLTRFDTEYHGHQQKI